MRNGECGPETRAGEGCRRGELESPGRTRLRRFRSKLLSDEGESVLTAPGKTEDGKLLSLLSPASMSARERPSREGCDVPRSPAALLWDRGVGHSNGLLEPVDTAAEDGLRSDCESNDRSGELRIDRVSADVGRRGEGAAGYGFCCNSWLMVCERDSSSTILLLSLRGTLLSTVLSGATSSSDEHEESLS